MVSIKFIVEIVVIIVALALVIYWLLTNFASISEEFWGLFNKLVQFNLGG